MRVKVLTFLMVLALVVVGCSSHEEEAVKATNAFLDNFLKLEFEEAATYCCDQFAPHFLESVKESGELSEDVKEKIVAMALQVEREILSVEPIEGSDTLVVSYSLTLPDVEERQESALFLVKSDKEWRVAAFKR